MIMPQILIEPLPLEFHPEDPYSLMLTHMEEVNISDAHNKIRKHKNRLI